MTELRMDERNADQIAFWNGPGGHLWTQRQDLQDRVLAPVSDLLFARAGAKAGEAVVDIGCGCGATSVELAARVGPSGFVLGVDVSAEMLARARTRIPTGAPMDFIEADATVQQFEPGRFDLLFSRFGVMFFAQPERSFANLRSALRKGGRVIFACWREPRLNPWAMTPLQAAYQHVPRQPEMGPEDPGMFSFAREERVRRILGASGYADIALEACDLEMDLAMGMGLDNAVRTATEFGPTLRAIKEHPPALQEAAKSAVRAALAPLVQGQRVPLGAAIWIVTATNP